jgi:hypothetical protein
MSDGSRLSRSTSSIEIFFAHDTGNEPAADVIIFADRLKQDLEKNGFSVQKVQELVDNGDIPGKICASSCSVANFLTLHLQRLMSQSLKHF